jgi:hypothetical protein
MFDDVLLQRFEQVRNSLIDTGSRLALRCRKKSISIVGLAQPVSGCGGP